MTNPKTDNATTARIRQLLAGMGSKKLPVIDLTLDRILRLLEALGSPHLNLPPVIHVAGTNGKGSLIAYLKAIFQAAGLRVHAYTSPELVRFNERIVLVGKEIEDRYLAEVLERVNNLLNVHPVTVFEATTAAAFVAFAETKADVLLLETGLGGRYDASNVVPSPVLTANTPVSLDHCEFLGNAIEGIAAEKAGIIKQGVPVVIGSQQPEALAVIERVAREKNAPAYRMGHEWTYGAADDGLVLHTRTHTMGLPRPALAGAHQLHNAALAAACIEVLRARAVFAPSEQHVCDGIAKAVWRARLQKLSSGPLMAHIPQNAQVWLDGGHNPAAGEALAQWAAAQDDAPLFVLCGMLSNKDARAFFAPLSGHVDSLATIAIPGRADAYDAVQLALKADEAGAEATPADSLEAGLALLGSQAKLYGKPCNILICGSLYLAGHILAENG